MESIEQNKTEETSDSNFSEKIELNKCDYCNKAYMNLDTFDKCNHKICAICLFRRIFILNITELNGISDKLIIKCNKCSDGTLKKDLEELCELSTKKTNIFKEMSENSSNSNYTDNSNQCKEHLIFQDQFCLDCCEHLCKKCKSNQNNIHYEHNILGNEKVTKILKAEINNIPLKFANKEQFDNNWNILCKKLKDSSQDIFNETMNKIEELEKAISDFKKEYSQKYKNELIKVINTLKAIKLFYFDYYFEKEEAEKGRDIDSLRYVNSINSELHNLELTKDITFCQKINDAKIILDNLKMNNNINFTTKFIYSKLKNNYNFEYEVKSAHDKFITSIIELKDDKLLTTSLDYSMKIWEEKDSKFNSVNTISKRCGAVISSLKIENDKILTSNNTNNAIYMWGPNPKEGFSIEQSFTLHSKVVISMIQLKNGNLVTSGMDNLIIVWKKNEGGSYEEKETIKEEFPAKKLISLKNNNFGYTGDDGVLTIMSETTENNISEEKNNEENKEETNTEENKKNEDEKKLGYKKICELKGHAGKISCICELKNGYLFTGGAKGNKSDHYILVWKPEGNNGYTHLQTLSGHKTDISDIIQLKDGRIISSSKDRTLIIWKATLENDVIKYVSDEVLTEYPHGMYGLLQLRDSRICTITSNNSLIFWRKWGSFPYC